MLSAGVTLLVLVSCCAAHPSCRGKIIQPELNEQRSVGQDSCKDCTQILELFADMVSNNDTQEKIKNVLHYLCNLLPAPKAKVYCVQQVDKYLPMAISILVKQINPGMVCKFLGICKNQSEDNGAEILINGTPKIDISVTEGTEAAQALGLPQCAICVFVIEKLECLLPKDKTAAAVEKLLDHVCSILPKPTQLLCNKFISAFSGKLINLLLSSAMPRTICTILQLCHGQELPPPVEKPPTDCQSCKTVVILSHFHLGSNATDQQTASFMQNVCWLHPYAMPKCELFTQRFGSQLQSVLGKMRSAQDMCEEAGLCAAVRETEAEAVKNCSKGGRYVCRDMRAAKACNSVSFCEKFFWQ
uniref:Prosaposin-like n=1 Tax=Paramormyrops kingsleyae TaxID=1676925 RepID=A0A3B3TCS1_9TELE|nr:prosaposin-like [Paramormyrops kingsleyae]